jgi:hypothetical protein
MLWSWLTAGLANPSESFGLPALFFDPLQIVAAAVAWTGLATQR